MQFGDARLPVFQHGAGLIGGRQDQVMPVRLRMLLEPCVRGLGNAPVELVLAAEIDRRLSEASELFEQASQLRSVFRYDQRAGTGVTGPG